mgnify:CR=1 FL=1
MRTILREIGYFYVAIFWCRLTAVSNSSLINSKCHFQIKSKKIAHLLISPRVGTKKENIEPIRSQMGLWGCINYLSLIAICGYFVILNANFLTCFFVVIVFKIFQNTFVFAVLYVVLCVVNFKHAHFVVATTKNWHKKQRESQNKQS